ncbi:conserved hypothetical protein [Mycoplasma leachii PG50]|uniref:Uncharacterized protein n=1 Tax=Mycoplasma leachii (strain DSM 21131 / NCTC 10133 / N29 / PG50) TaxID=880447 RepID=E4PUJ0_MYCLG|nr:hypothetical protein [Mycoplasma leachii]ADR23811.1 conserved hypothetical protein [Mycoplasma leachii PG50]CBV67281.1 Putative uncharacterized protein [Mycoplasma leachii 99/014/6]
MNPLLEKKVTETLKKVKAIVSDAQDNVNELQNIFNNQLKKLTKYYVESSSNSNSYQETKSTTYYLAYYDKRSKRFKEAELNTSELNEDQNGDVQQVDTPNIEYLDGYKNVANLQSGLKTKFVIEKISEILNAIYNGVETYLKDNLEKSLKLNYYEYELSKINNEEFVNLLAKNDLKFVDWNNQSLEEKLNQIKDSLIEKNNQIIGLNKRISELDNMNVFINKQIDNIDDQVKR